MAKKKKILSDEELLALLAENPDREKPNEPQPNIDSPQKNKKESKKKSNEVSKKNTTSILLDKPSTIEDKSKKVSKQLKKHKIDVLTIYRLPKSKSVTNIQKNNQTFLKFVQKVEHFLINDMLIDGASKIVLAVSGGVDSMTLLDVMAILAEKYQFKLAVAHFNHNLRGADSNKDLDFVKNEAKNYGIPFYFASGKVKKYAEKNSISIETAARVLRYNFFERVSRNFNADFVATAHTANDSVETFFINLFRGSGLTGLCGIPFRRQLIKDVLLIRPLIDFKKNELIEYANIRNIKWREDNSNSLLEYTRNKVRLDLIPKLENDFNPSIIDVINRTTRLIQSADRIIHNYVKKHLPDIIENVSSDSFCFNIPILSTFDKFVQGEMMQTAFLKYFRLSPPSLAKIDRILDLIDSETGAFFEITKSITVAKDRNHLVFFRNFEKKEINLIINKIGTYTINGYKINLQEVNKRQVKLSNSPNEEYLDFDLVPSLLYIRNWKDGDSFQPLGMQGTVKISDFLTNQKISFLERSKILVLCSKNDIIWVIGKRISEKYKIKEDTKRFLKIELNNM
ncbi:MAG: tRNA lysidine(34) synthetase TilS [Ignavibacteria bacterium]|nr:tRNA lysidine(34) synthetase TilS [Ignavibacteria bacterium]